LTEACETSPGSGLWEVSEPKDGFLGLAGSTATLQRGSTIFAYGEDGQTLDAEAG
jgi:hypothetical protein